MSGLMIDLDASSIRALKDELDATDAQVEASMKSTYSKMGRWLRTRGVRGLSAKLRIKQKILRARVKSFRMEGGIVAQGTLGAKVWFGLRPIPLIRLNARQVAGGVRAAGGRYVKGAFIAKVYGRERVMIRKGKARLPIETVYADIDDVAMPYIENDLVRDDEFDAQFFKLLEHELKWRTTPKRA